MRSSVLTMKCTCGSRHAQISFRSRPTNYRLWFFLGNRNQMPYRPPLIALTSILNRSISLCFSLFMTYFSSACAFLSVGSNAKHLRYKASASSNFEFYQAIALTAPRARQGGSLQLLLGSDFSHDSCQLTVTLRPFSRTCDDMTKCSSDPIVTPPGRNGG